MLADDATGACEFRSAFRENLRSVGLHQLAEGLGQGETQAGVDARPVRASRHAGRGFTDDAGVAHQLGGNVRQALPQTARQRCRGADLRQGLQHQAINGITKVDDLPGQGFGYSRGLLLVRKLGQHGVNGSRESRFKIGPLLFQRVVFLPDGFEAGVMRVFAVRGRTLALADDFLDRFQGSRRRSGPAATHRVSNSASPKATATAASLSRR